MHEDLEALREANGEGAAALHTGEGALRDDAGLEALAKRRDEQVGGGDGILDGEVDADAADGRHGVGGVADAEQAGAMPAAEVIDLDGERLELRPVSELGDAGAAVGVGLG